MACREVNSSRGVFILLCSYVSNLLLVVAWHFVLSGHPFVALGLVAGLVKASVSPFVLGYLGKVVSSLAPVPAAPLRRRVLAALMQSQDSSLLFGTGK